MKTKLKINVPEMPVVGEYYNVLCARLEVGKKSMYMPVIGKVHADPQFSSQPKHIHIDGRFARDFKSFQLINGKTNVIIDMSGKYVRYPFMNFVVRRLKCLRTVTGIVPPDPFFINATGKLAGLKYWEWYSSMVGKNCKGKKCPHLGTTMIETNGELVCPLHALVGCIKTEVIKTRPEVDVAHKMMLKP